MNQGEKIVGFLSAGREATNRELSTRFNIGNVRAAVDSIRPALQSQGFDIYSNTRTNTKGVTTSKYRIGTTTNTVHFGRSDVDWFRSAKYKELARAGLV